jgi:hypothetical protein
MAQGVSRLRLTTETRVCGICGGQGHTLTGFLWILQFSLVSLLTHSFITVAVYA